MCSYLEPLFDYEYHLTSVSSVYCLREALQSSFRCILTGEFQSHPADSQDLMDKDCLSCKVIGTSTMLGASVYVVYGTMKGRSRFSGIRRYLYYGQAISLTTCKQYSLLY